MEIKLTKGEIVTIDDCDYDLIKNRKWCFHKGAAVSNRGGYTLMHRLILNAPQGSVVDHVDGNPLNNRRENIRICTQSQNLMNKRIKKNKKTSKYKGVFFDKRRNYYTAEIKKKDNRIYLGSFKCETKAALAYDKMAEKVYGQFAKLNFGVGVLSV